MTTISRTTIARTRASTSSCRCGTFCSDQWETKLFHGLAVRLRSFALQLVSSGLHQERPHTTAGLLLVEEAGGRVLPYPGTAGLRSGGAVLASGPALYDSLAAIARW